MPGVLGSCGLKQTRVTRPCISIITDHNHCLIVLKKVKDSSDLVDLPAQIKCDFIGRDGYFETARIAVETVP